VKLGDLTAQEVAAELTGAGIRLRVGPFNIRVQNVIEKFAPAFHFLYGDFPMLRDDEAAQFRIRRRYPVGVRRWWRQQVLFFLDDTRPFEPFPATLAMPFFEWGFNWCVYDHVNEFLLIHAAVVEKNGGGLIMPAAPGSGKSTLCAGLIHRGWRLLSDEFAIIGKTDGRIIPIPRPIGLKEQSIEVIRNLDSSARIGPVFADTRKGKVAHLRPTREAVEKAQETAMPAWLVFPKFESGAGMRLAPIDKTAAFVEAWDSCFNYKLLGEDGFNALTSVVERCGCFRLNFGDMSAALDALEDLASLPPRANAGMIAQAASDVG